MRATKSGQGPSALEQLVGGDSYRGVYVPPLMAEVMKELEAERLQTSEPATDIYAGPSAQTPKKALSAETKARLDEVAKAPSLDEAFVLLRKMPELKESVAKQGVPEIAVYDVADRDGKARKAAMGLIIEGSSGNARYFGSELTIFAAVAGDKLMFGSQLDKLYGYSDMRSNRFGITYERSTERIRTGLWGHLPFSVGPRELARSVPELSPASLSAKVADFLSTSA